MTQPTNMGQLAADLENLKKQFEHYKGLVEDAFRKLDDRITKLEKSK